MVAAEIAVPGEHGRQAAVQVRHGQSLSRRANLETIHHNCDGQPAHAARLDVSVCEYTLRLRVSLRIAFDLDGVLADMDSALAAHAEDFFGKALDRARRAGARTLDRGVLEHGSGPGPGRLEPDAPPAAPALAPYRGRRKLLADAAGNRGRLGEAARRSCHGTAVANHFLTKRPATAGLSAQVQSQRWLVERGFERPSAYVVKGSRGLIAAALGLDIVVDDRPESCRDVIAESSARAILVWRNPSPQHRWLPSASASAW